VLSNTYEKSRTLTLERSRVWYTQRNTAFIATYVEAIKNCERDFVVASRSLTAPEEEILEAVEIALKKGVSVRVVRQITDAWSLEDFRRYEKVLEAGSQVRYLDVKQIPLRFMVFDQKDVILVFPAESQGTRPQIIEALWLRIQPLAEILHEHFEELWRKGKPVAPILEEMKKRKQKGRKTV
jgi:sugar-specific transcriptional regulator TrmB